MKTRTRHRSQSTRKMVTALQVLVMRRLGSRTSASRTAPQLLVLDKVAGCLDDLLPQVPGYCAANEALLESLEVTVVHAWLR